MANRTDELKRPLGGDEAQIIRDQIKETRTQMGLTIEQIQKRLSPEWIKQETQEAIQNAMIGKVQQATNEAEHGMKSWPTGATRTVFRAYLTVILGISSRIGGYFHKQLRKFWKIQPHFYTEAEGQSLA